MNSILDLQHFFFSYLESRNITKPINELGREEIRTYVQYLQSSRRWPNRVNNNKDYGKLSEFTIQGKVRAIKAFWSWLLSEGDIDINPLVNFNLPTVPKNLIVILSKVQLNQLLKAIDRYTLIGARNYCILLLLLDTGLRVSELVRISLNDLDLAQRYIRVTGKGQKQRIVPIHRIAKKELTKYINRYRPGLCEIESVYLFPVKDGEHISINCVQQLVRRLAMKAGLQNIRCHPHIFRHTFATSFLAKGGSSAALQEILGHESSQTTSKYVHLQPEDLRRQHNQYSPLEDLFDK